jgi:glycogen phosphorylase/synthase
MNGVMHFSVLDGWWVEGYRADAGWMLPAKRTFENQGLQDELDSEMIYNIIDDDIAPLFYEKDQSGLSPQWICMIKNTIAKVASNFTTNRMLEDYERQYYIPMSERYHKMIANNYEMATKITEWKRKVSREWDNIELVGLTLPNRSKQVIALGKSYSGEVKLELGELNMHEVGVEMVVAEQEHGRQVIRARRDFTPVEQEGSVALYRIEVTADSPGLLMLAIRIYPKNGLLPHRTDAEVIFLIVVEVFGLERVRFESRPLLHVEIVVLYIGFHAVF